MFNWHIVDIYGRIYDRLLYFEHSLFKNFLCWSYNSVLYYSCANVVIYRENQSSSRARVKQIYIYVIQVDFINLI